MGHPRQHSSHHDHTEVYHRAHDHLWTSSDGTGLHAPPGQVVRDRGTGDVCCHVCGEFFRALGSHIRAHGYTAAQYRRAMGLSRAQPLTSTGLSESISRRQRQSYAASPEHRQRLEPGQEMVRDGRLTELAKTSGHMPLQSERLRSAALEQGRRTREQHRREAMSERVDELGIDELGPWLCATYTHGTSLADLADTLGIGHQRLRSELKRAGVDLRPQGANSARGKRSRAIANEQRAAQRVGTDDLKAWLNEQHRCGASLSELARRVGHSTHWVRWRLDSSEQPDTSGSDRSVELRRIDL